MVALVASIVLGLQTAFQLEDGEVAIYLYSLELNVGIAQTVGREVGDVARYGELRRDLHAGSGMDEVAAEAYLALDADTHLLLSSVKVEVKLLEVQFEGTYLLGFGSQRPFAEVEVARLVDFYLLALNHGNELGVAILPFLLSILAFLHEVAGELLDHVVVAVPLGALEVGQA